VLSAHLQMGHFDYTLTQEDAAYDEVISCATLALTRSSSIPYNQAPCRTESTNIAIMLTKQHETEQKFHIDL
jgi:hypothetical protein